PGPGGDSRAAGRVLEQQHAEDRVFDACDTEHAHRLHRRREIHDRRAPALERDAFPLQPRVRRAGKHKSLVGVPRSGHRPVAARGGAAWNTGLDSAYAFKTLLAPGSPLQVVNITDPEANMKLAADLMAKAGQTAAGKARIALMAALAGIPGWFLPTQPEPAPTDYAAQAAAQALWESRVDFPFAFGYRAELERRAGGNPSWNAGVDYRRQLENSPYHDEVTTLYRDAGLDLNSDLAALNA